MNQRFFYTFSARSVVSLLISICVLGSSTFARTRVQIQMGGMTGTSCDTASFETFVTGSVGQIAVMVWSVGIKTPFNGPPDKAPDWLRLEFSYGDERGSFVPSAALHDLLRPVYFIEKSQTQSWNPDSKTPVYYFQYELPEVLAGTEICVRAALAPPPYGDVMPDQSPVSCNLACIKIVAPCSQEDRDLVLASHVLMAHDAGDNERAVALADSLLNTGWRSLWGLSVAKTSANELKEYQLSLRFLDAMFETYGVVEHPFDGTNGHVDHPDAEAYQAYREILIQAIAEQERQR